MPAETRSPSSPPEIPAEVPKSEVEIAKEEAYASIGKELRSASDLGELAAAWKAAQEALKTFPVRWQAELTGDKDRRKAQLQANTTGAAA
jgi:hypothetical protein